ncbi:MAG: tRNA (N6-isopentenyl adenosine(37)-C2)-methylthiotransferase MiaB [Lentisphaeraceae bacterium]|nr:tRNA (N6-isopentenyl adenosine(37)-C2)-methylthiotransferase MiaB [Lentisphaeraceae bacterium]
MQTDLKKVFIKTYGCQMNDRDSEAVAQDMKHSGYTMTDDEKDADVILFNTCSVRDQAERKAMGKIGIIKKYREKKPNLKIGVIGCMAQSKGEEITDKYGHVDVVVGTDQLHKIPELLEKSEKEKTQIVSRGLSRDILDRLEVHPEGQISAQVSIMRGCNEYCTYCIVPFTRGQEKSRPIASIITEVKALVDKGVREIMYLGQNITAYGIIEARKERKYDKEVSPFAELLRETAKIEGIKRIRFTSPHARYFNDDLIDTIAAEPKISRMIHFPLQSGSDKILKVMRRRHTAADFMVWVNKLKDRVEGVTFSTDLIVGFPGESDEDFEATRQMCNEIDFDQEFIFRYSKRRNTPAAQMPNQLDEDLKMERNQTLLADLAERLTAKNEKLVGTLQEVLVEGPSKRNSERWNGRNPNHKIVIFDPQDGVKVGDLVKIKIDMATQHSLYGEYVEHSPNN